MYLQNGFFKYCLLASAIFCLVSCVNEIEKADDSIDKNNKKLLKTFIEPPECVQLQNPAAQKKNSPQTTEAAQPESPAENNQIVFNQTLKKTPPEKIRRSDDLLVTDFNRDGSAENELNPLFGEWIIDPYDQTMFCKLTYYRSGIAGHAIQLTYDLNSPNSAYGGMWIKFYRTATRYLDLSPYRYLCMDIKGSATHGFSSVIRLELKGIIESGTITLNDITSHWKKFSILLTDFKGISDWSSIKELVITLDDELVTAKEGVLYFDDIGFSKRKPSR